jgi:hypothetical protein
LPAAASLLSSSLTLVTGLWRISLATLDYTDRPQPHATPTDCGVLVSEANEGLEELAPAVSS